MPAEPFGSRYTAASGIASVETLRFPEDFFFGAAASGPQTEGRAERRGAHIFDLWYEEEPGAFFDRVGPEVTSDFYHRYRDDIALMRYLNLDSYRHSIVWSRLIPDGTGEVDGGAVSFYRDMFGELRRNGIRPFMNLFHFDLPVKLQMIGGWENRRTVSAFVRYAETCFKLFGDLIDTWFTFNEPVAPAEEGYLEGVHYPNVRDVARAMTVGFHVMLAHAGAVEAFRRLGARGEIGIILNLAPSYPGSASLADRRAAALADLLYNRSFLDPCLLGRYPKSLARWLSRQGFGTDILPGDLELIRRNRIDLLGVNYYRPRRVRSPRPRDTEAPGENVIRRYFEPYLPPHARINPSRGWEIYEQGIYDALIRLKEEYGNPRCFVSENGIGIFDELRFLKNGIIQDVYRIDFITRHLKWIHRAMRDGSACEGYHIWTFADCWSWHNAYRNRYGLVSIDLQTQQRTVKASGEWYRDLAVRKEVSPGQ
jgi:6-phospho-beta-glucosidase